MLSQILKDHTETQTQITKKLSAVENCGFDFNDLIAEDMELVFSQTAESLKFANYMWQSHYTATKLILEQSLQIDTLKMQMVEANSQLDQVFEDWRTE